MPEFVGGLLVVILLICAFGAVALICLGVVVFIIAIVKSLFGGIKDEERLQ